MQDIEFEEYKQEKYYKEEDNPEYADIWYELYKTGQINEKGEWI